MIIKNAHVFIDGEFHDVDVRYDNEKILEIGTDLKDKEIIDAKGNYLFAGFVETHMHGGFRRSFFRNDYDAVAKDWNGEEDIKYILSELPKYGVTSVMPTFDSQGPEDCQNSLRIIRRLRKEGVGADPFKIHYEGPFLNPERSAAIDPALSVLPSKEHTLKITDNDLSDIGIMCLAPELPGAKEWCEWITSQGVHVEIGYTLCSSEQVKECCDWGADTTTHFYNGYEGMHHRKDGGIVGCLLEDRLTHQMTMDAFHVAPAWVKLAIKLKGIDKIYGMTDMTHFSGLTDGEYENDFYGTIVVNDGIIKVKESGMLLGGNNTWDKMMRRARDRVGLSFMEVCKAYGENPAKCLNITDRGKIEVGRRSDFCLMDKDFNVIKTIIKGKTYYENNK